MALDLSDIRSEVESNLGGRTNTTRFNRLINLAQVRIARAWNWRELQTRDTAAGPYTGVPATDKTYTGFTSLNLRELLTLVRYVGSETPVKLTRLPQRQWDQVIAVPENVTGVGDPEFYMLHGDRTVELWPVPSRAWTMQRTYTLWPTDLALDTAESDLLNKDDIIIAMATHLAFQSLGMLEDAARWFAIYREGEKQAKEEDAEKPDLTLMNIGIADSHRIQTTPWADPFVRSTRSD